MSITRHGINRNETGPLMRCSFEETVDRLLGEGKKSFCNCYMHCICYPGSCLCDWRFPCLCYRRCQDCTSYSDRYALAMRTWDDMCESWGEPDRHELGESEHESDVFSQMSDGSGASTRATFDGGGIKSDSDTEDFQIKFHSSDDG